MNLTQHPGPGARVVIILHGIRTRGTWQKSITSPLAEAGYIPVPLDYGWFSALPFLIPGCRRRKIDWFRDEYNRIINEYRVVPYLIAHSFGTYIALRSAQKYTPTMRFQKVILCGSIVRADYPWTEMLESGLVENVLNDQGGLDNWAGLVQHFIADAGPSGKTGFFTNHPRLTQRNHPEWGHSDYFFSRNFTERWIPFLNRADIP